MYLNIYNNNPTAGSTDGSLVSSGDSSNPITLGPLNLSNSEVSTWVKLAIRTDSGYVSAAETIIIPTGTNSTRWQLAPDSSNSPGTPSDYGSSLTLATGISATNNIFWVRANTVATDTPMNDLSVSLNVQCALINLA